MAGQVARLSDWSDLSLKLLYITCTYADEPSINSNCKLKLNYINMCLHRGLDTNQASNEHFHLTWPSAWCFWWLKEQVLQWCCPLLGDWRWDQVSMLAVWARSCCPSWCDPQIGDTGQTCAGDKTCHSAIFTQPVSPVELSRATSPGCSNLQTFTLIPRSHLT